MTHELPPGWIVRGDIPETVVDPASRDWDQWPFVEDLWQAQTPDRSYTLDVGWYPEGDPQGAFNCLLVKDENWAAHEDRLRTPLLHEVRDWVEATVLRLLTRGIRGSTSYSIRRPPAGPRRALTGGIRAGAGTHAVS